MRTIQKFFSMILFVALPVITMAQDKDKKTETVKFNTSIDCENCVNKIMTNLPFEKGIKDVKCDLETKEVAVTYQKEKNNPENIQRAIEKLGYTAKVITEEQEKKKK
jgi:mercuric ion binding protein